MVSESWLTYKEVAHTADELWHHKKTISALTVYEALGRRGSKATIQKHLNLGVSILTNCLNRRMLSYRW